MQLDSTPTPPPPGPGEHSIVVKAVKLRVGAKVVARVVKGAGSDGRGKIAIAGTVVRARLPKGLRAGQRLQLQVAAQSGNQMLLRMAREAASPRRPLPARLAAALAAKGDGELLRAAVCLQGGVIPLPGRRTVEIEEDARSEAEAGESEAGRGDRVRLTLHTKELGAVELSLGLYEGRLDAVVVVDGAMVERARAALPSLAAAIETSTGVRAAVTLQRRDGPPPIVPEVELLEDERYA